MQKKNFLNSEEAELLREIQIQFLKTYLCKPPTEFLEVCLFLHRLQKSLEKALSNITIQLQVKDSPLNIQLQNQIAMMSSSRMMQ